MSADRAEIIREQWTKAGFAVSMTEDHNGWFTITGKGGAPEPFYRLGLCIMHGHRTLTWISGGNSIAAIDAMIEAANRGQRETAE